MEVLALLAFGLVMAVLVGAVMGIVAYTQVRSLRAEIDQLRQQFLRRDAPSDNPLNAEATATDMPLDLDLEPDAVAARDDGVSSAAVNVDSEDAHEPEPRQSDSIDDQSRAQQEQDRLTLARIQQAGPTATAVAPSRSWFDQLQEQWMVWLGGACVALAGIFLAKYSIEQGLLGPTARIVSGVLTGFALHFAALWLRAKHGNHPSFAALAGGGSITLFAALLAALHFYQMFSATTVFILLALVAVATLWLTLLHGPVLAAIGMLGAYSVPLLVSTGSGNMAAAMLYALVISASVLWLLRYVYRPWLWWGLMAGGLLWWAVSFDSHQVDGWRGVYLALFAYGLLAVIDSNWLLLKRFDYPIWPFGKIDLSKGTAYSELPLSLALVVLAQALSIWHNGWVGNWLNASLLSVLLLWAAGRNNGLTGLAGLTFIGQWLALLARQLDWVNDQWVLQGLSPEQQPDFFVYAGLTAWLYAAFALRNLRAGAANSWWAAMLTLTPVLALLECNLLGAEFSSPWQWALLAVVIGAVYVWLAVVAQQRQWQTELQAWLFLGGHLAYAVAAAWVLSEASLTLAFAVQIISIAWVIQRFDMPQIAWLLKTVVVLVVVRLTLNPWLASYPTDLHWSLWTYGGATLCCMAGVHWLKATPALARWAEAAALHLFVLTVWAEARYWLHDGATFSDRFEFPEAVLNTLLFSTMALVYRYKAQVSQNLAGWYTLYSRLQLGFGAVNYCLIVVAILVSEPWAWGAVSARPIFNLALLALGGPVLIGWLIARYYEPAAKNAALLFTAFAAFLFISLEIRHVWQGSLRLSGATSTGEMYTYSAVWLVCAVVALLGGSWRFGRRCYQGGMALLALVIVKIFLVDLSDLEGLWRVASFMGLGLALLGIAFLHQKIQANSSPAEREMAS